MTSSPVPPVASESPETPTDVRGRHAASRPWPRRPLVLTAAGAAAVAVAVATLFAVGIIGGTSYPHPWCGPLLAQLHSSRESEQAFESSLSQIQRQDQAPVGKLLSDLYAYDIAHSAEQNASDLTIEGSLAGEMGALDTVGSDLQILNSECGQPPGAYKKDSF